MRLPGYTYYGFRSCVGAFFEMSTDNARALLPPHLEPLEVQHTRSILALTAFDFDESSVGEYYEIVLAIIVPPMVEKDKPLPKAAFFPFIVGTSTEASRLHAIERWNLPHYPKELDIGMEAGDGKMDVTVRDGNAPVLDFSVTSHEYLPCNNLYNAFTVDLGGGPDRFKMNIYMKADHSEHEEENGSLTLYEHEMTKGLNIDDVNDYPFREQWYGKGLQTFEPILKI